MRIGRLVECDVCLDDPSVSRYHALIQYEGKHWFLSDTRSTNGTFLNRVRLSDRRVPISQGNFVQFGDVALVVESVESVTEAGWFSCNADPSKMLVLLRQHPLSHIVPDIGRAIQHLVSMTIQAKEAPFLFSKSNPNPQAMYACEEACLTQDELAEIQRSVILEAIRHPFHSFGRVNGNILAWNDETVVKLAKSIRESSDFSLMPILADALEEAGCNEHDILVHCRQRTQHLTCCWALRAVLDAESNHHEQAKLESRHPATANIPPTRSQ